MTGFNFAYIVDIRALHNVVISAKIDNEMQKSDDGYDIKVCEIEVFETSKNLKCLKEGVTASQTSSSSNIFNLGSMSLKQCHPIYKSKGEQGHIKIAAYFSLGEARNKGMGSNGKILTLSYKKINLFPTKMLPLLLNIELSDIITSMQFSQRDTRLATYHKTHKVSNQSYSEKIIALSGTKSKLLCVKMVTVPFVAVPYVAGYLIAFFPNHSSQFFLSHGL